MSIPISQFPVLLGDVSIWLTFHRRALCFIYSRKVCTLFSRSVLLPVSRKGILPSLRLLVPESSYSSKGSQFCHWEDLKRVISTWEVLSMAGCPWTSFPLGARSSMGLSVLIGLEPLQICPLQTFRSERASLTVSDLSTRLCVKHRGGGGRGTSSVSTSRAELWSWALLSRRWVLVERNGADGSGAGLRNGRERGGTQPCWDSPLWPVRPPVLPSVTSHRYLECSQVPFLPP